jgi:hypothetical protein
MYRATVSLTLSLLIAALAFWFNGELSGAAERGAREAATQQLSVSLEALRQMQRLESAALVARARKISDDERLVALLQGRPKVTEDYLSRHDGVDALLVGWRDVLTAQEGSPEALSGADLADWGAARPYAMFVVDRGGVCVANISNQRCYAQDDKGTPYTRMAELYPALKAALSGERFFDIWTVDGQPVLVGVSPVWAPGASRVQPRGEVAGAVVLGYLLNRSAQQHKRVVGVEVGVTHAGALSSSSSLDGKLERALSDALSAQLKAGPLAAEEPLEVDLLGERYWLRAAPLAGYQSAEGVQAIVALHWSERARELSINAPPVIPVAAGAILVALVVFWGASQRFLRPFKEVEVGVLEVTNGNLDYWFTYSVPDNGLTGTLAQNLDIMVSKYSGRPMPEIEGEPGEGERR